jgi:hypothetical protein
MWYQTLKSVTWTLHGSSGNPLLVYYFLIYFLNKQSQYKVFDKLMFWLAGSLTCRLISVVSSPPARRSRKFNHEWYLASHRWGFYITYNDAPQAVGLLWTSGQLVEETSTWQHTTITTDRHPCSRWDLNPRSQQATGRRPTPWTVRPLGSAVLIYKLCLMKQPCLWPSVSPIGSFLMDIWGLSVEALKSLNINIKVLQNKTTCCLV